MKEKKDKTKTATKIKTNKNILQINCFNCQQNEMQLYGLKSLSIEDSLENSTL